MRRPLLPPFLADLLADRVAANALLASFAQLQNAIAPADLAQYRDAYLTGVRVAMLGAGLVTLAGAALAWATLGRRNPLQAMYEHREEGATAG